MLVSTSVYDKYDFGMIYLRPIGGLCNRIRTIDSLISICKIEKRDLTVLWVEDSSLNCSFIDIYKTPIFEEFDFKIIDCPQGYPEKYLNPNCILIQESAIEHVADNYFLQKAKNILKGRRLDKVQENIKNSLQALDNDCILTNEKLAELYASDTHVGNKSVADMDSLFIPKAQELLKSKLVDCDITYISSCYRIYPLENHYTSFLPINDIVLKVEEISRVFQQTFGLHIRRSDHVTSKSVSTTDKFVKIVENTLIENPQATFFVSTDDAETKSGLISKFGDKIITNEVSSYDRSDENAVMDAMVDLYCLSRTQKIYGSHHSSFSQTAANIGNVEEVTAK